MFRIDKKGNFKDSKQNEPDAEEQLLESIIFRDSKSVITNLKKKRPLPEEEPEQDKELDEQQVLFLIDNKGDYQLLESSSEDAKAQKPVWEDDDDEIGFDQAFSNNVKKPRKFGQEHKFKDYLEHKFKSLNPQPQWATKLTEEKKSTEEDDLERIAGDVATNLYNLDSSSLNYKTCGPIDRVEYGTGAYQSVEFHPLDNYAMLSKREYACLYKIDDRNHQKVKTIKFNDFKIEQASIRPGGHEMILTSARQAGRMYYYDFLSDQLIKVPLLRGAKALVFQKFVFSPDDRYICGTSNQNMVYIMDANTKEIVQDLKINSDSVATCFSTDSSKVLVHSGEGKVYVFDIRKKGRCMHRFADEGCIQGTAMAISPNAQYIACGSSSGIVNVYDYATVLSEREPKPLKTIPHLVTAINRIKFNHSSQVMSICSDQIDNQIKCLQLPSFNVFADFPRLATNYGKVTDVAFSPHSYYYAFANQAGKSHLMRLLSFDQY